MVRVGATRQIRKADHEAIRTHLSTWLANIMIRWDQSRGDEAEPRRTVDAPAGVPFEVTLVRWHRKDSTLLIARGVPDDLEEQRAARVAEALRRKAPKLAAEKAKGRSTVLVLESNDIALGNADVIADALTTALAACAEPPDNIYLVETEALPSYVHVLKSDAGTFA